MLPISVLTADSPEGWLGTLNLEFARADETTQLIHSQVQAPLKVQRPFYPEGGAVCHSVILHTAGGLVGGDRLNLNLTLHPGAHALLTTASAGKIYRSNGQQAHQTITIHVAEGACIEWLPQETIVFEGAEYRQDLRVNLAPDAFWLSWEITRLGRSARGEQFLQGNWRSRTEIWQQNRPLWIDPQWIKGDPVVFNRLHGLAGCPIVGSLAFVGQSVSKDIVEQARTLFTAHNYQGEAGVTRLQSGLLCRYRGASSSEVRRWFIDVWQLLRLSYLGRPACPPRVWQL